MIEFDKEAAAKGRADRAVEMANDLGWGFSRFMSRRGGGRVTDRNQYTDGSLTFIVADIALQHLRP